LEENPEGLGDGEAQERRILANRQDNWEMVLAFNWAAQDGRWDCPAASNHVDCWRTVMDSGCCFLLMSKDSGIIRIGLAGRSIIIDIINSLKIANELFDRRANYILRTANLRHALYDIIRSGYLFFLKQYGKEIGNAADPSSIKGIG